MELVWSKTLPYKYIIPVDLKELCQALPHPYSSPTPLGKVWGKGLYSNFELLVILQPYPSPTPVGGYGVGME